MTDNQPCDLCAGKCRGHSLGRSEEWTPEQGSRAALTDNTHAKLADRLEIACRSAEKARSKDHLAVEPFLVHIAYIVEADLPAILAALRHPPSDDAMREALRPFAEKSKKAMDEYTAEWPKRVGPDYTVFGWNGSVFTLGDFLNAQAALAPKGEA